MQSVEVTLLDREIWQALTNAEPDVDALVAKILHRAELEYEFCSAGDADPATMQIRKACAEYDLTDGFPYTFIKRSSARLFCTVTPTLKSDCKTDKSCKEEKL